MTTKLSGPLRREIEVEGKAYTLTLDGNGLKLTEKGHRKGVEFGWRALLHGDAAAASPQPGSSPPAP